MEPPGLYYVGILFPLTRDSGSGRAVHPSPTESSGPVGTTTSDLLGEAGVRLPSSLPVVLVTECSSDADLLPPQNTVVWVDFPALRNMVLLQRVHFSNLFNPFFHFLPQWFGHLYWI